MPNWSSNALKVTGEESEAFLSKALEAGKEMLNAFYPMPKALSGHNISKLGAEYFIPFDDPILDDTYSWMKLSDEDMAPYLVSEEMILRNVRLYGADGWYSWRLKYWGTKWDTTATKKDEDTLLFDTAWVPPVPWLTEVSEQYLEAHFTLVYAERGQGFFGFLVMKNGEIVEEMDSHEFWVNDPDWNSLKDIWEEEGMEAYDKANEEMEKVHMNPALKELVDTYGIGLGG